MVTTAPPIYHAMVNIFKVKSIHCRSKDGLHFTCTINYRHGNYVDKVVAKGTYYPFPHKTHIKFNDTGWVSLTPYSSFKLTSLN